MLGPTDDDAPDRGRPRILGSIASNYAALGAQIAWLGLLTPYLIAERGAQTFGEWTIVLSVAGYLRILDLGLGTAVARFVAAEPERERPVVATSFAALSLLGVAGVLVAAVTGAVVGGSLGLAVAIGGGASSVQVPLRLASHLLYGYGRMIRRNLFLIARAIMSAAGVVLSVAMGGGLVAIVAASAGAELLVGVLQATWVARSHGLLDLRAADVEPRLARTLGAFGLGALGLMISTQIVLYSDALVIGAALGPALAGVYAVAMRLVEGVTLVLSQVSDVFMPLLARLQRAAGRDEALRIVRLGVVVMLVLAGPAAAVLAGAGEVVMRVWVGTGFDAAVTPLTLLAAGVLFSAPLRFLVLWALATSQHRRVAGYALAEAVANVVLSIALVHPWGLTGVAVATLATLAVSNGWLIPSFLLGRSGLRGWAAYYRPVAVTAVITFASAAVIRLTTGELDSDGARLGLALGLAGAEAVVLGGLLLTRPQRRAAREIIGARARGALPSTP